MNYDLVIIGGGPAGVTAGIYAVRKDIKTLIITKDFLGQTGKAATVENWPGIQKTTGLELMQSFRDHVKSYSIDVLEGESVMVLNKRDSLFILKTSKAKEIKSKSVIISSGKNPRPLKIPGENEFLGKGVVYCAVCDAPLFAGKNVAIIGGGNAGFETALEMKRRNCPEVYILEACPKLLADEILQKEAKEAGIQVLLRARIREICGDNFVKSIKYTDMNTKEDKVLNIEGVFVEIGSIPVIDFVGDLTDCNEKKEIVIDHAKCTTKTPGLFAAGDVTDTPYKQIVIAAGEGAKAALSAYEYLNEQNKVN
mgnify:FL=1